MTDKLISTAQRKANSYKSPTTFMDGFNYALEVADKVPSVSSQVEISRLKQQNEYILQQNVLLMQKLKEANDKAEQLNRIIGGSELDTIDLDEITKHVCAYFKIKPSDVTKKTRLTAIRLPRQIISYIAQVYCTGITVTMIGAYFNQDHSTQVHTKQVIGELYDTDKNIKKIIDNICSTLFTNDSPVAN